MSKNPYELRYDIYQQAQQRVMDKYYQDHEQWSNFEEWKRDREAEGETITARPAVPDRPFFPTHEEILSEANKIYDFVQRCN